MIGWPNEIEILLDGAGIPFLCSMHHLHTLPETTTKHSPSMAAIMLLSAVRSFNCTECAEILVCTTNSALSRSIAFGSKSANMRNRDRFL